MKMHTLITLAGLMSAALATAGEFVAVTPPAPLPRLVTNEWNSASAWQGGRAPGAPGDVIRSGGRLTTDRLWVLDGAATFGVLDWESNHLRIIAAPKAKASIVMDNAGKPAEWNLQKNGGLMVNVPVTYKGDFILRPGGGEFNEPVSGDGKLIIDWNQGGGEKTGGLLFRGRGGNQLGGGFEVRVTNPVREGGSVTLVGAGVLTTTNIVLNGAATLVLESRPEDNLIADGAAVYLTEGPAGTARIRVHRGAKEVIRRLFINGVPQYAGTYGDEASGADFALNEHFGFRGGLAGGGVLVVTEGPSAPGTVRDLGVAKLEPTRATVGAEIASAAEPVDVTLFWGPEDGRRDPAAWKNKVALGKQAAGAKISATLSGQSLDRLYYRWFITGAGGGRWANASGALRLAGAPELKALPAVLHRGSATFRGEVAENGAATSLVLGWGLKAGGDQPQSWEKRVELAAGAAGLVSTNLTVPESTVVHFRWFAKNAYGAAASEAGTFTSAGPAKPGDVTFFCTSDTHFTEFEEEMGSRYRGLELMNTLPGKPYPAGSDGVVDVPRGVLALGDLINDGAVPERAPKQWAVWTNAFGLVGERRLAYPVYEGFGNHDLSGPRLVQKAIIERNKSRIGLSNISTNGLHYAWDWDQLHLIHLNLFPGVAAGSDQYGPIHNAENSLAFLKEDLAKNVGTSGRPVLLVHHYDVHDNWWTEAQRDAYYEVIKGYNVIGIVYGHTGTGIGKWRGLDYINDGGLGGKFFVFHITPDRMVVLCRDNASDDWKGPSLTKPITAGNWKPK